MHVNKFPPRHRNKHTFEGETPRSGNNGDNNVAQLKTISHQKTTKTVVQSNPSCGSLSGFILVKQREQ